MSKAPHASDVKALVTSTTAPDVAGVRLVPAPLLVSRCRRVHLADYTPAWPHGALTPFLDELWYVMGTNRVHHDGRDLQTSRTMLVARDGARLVLVNSVRLDEAGLGALDAASANRAANVRRERALDARAHQQQAAVQS